MLLEVITIVSNCGRLSSMFSAIRLKETKCNKIHLIILGKADIKQSTILHFLSTGSIIIYLENMVTNCNQ